MPTKLEAWAAEIVGQPVPFKANGRNRDGADCYGLIGMGYRAVFGVELPSFADRYELPRKTDSPKERRAKVERIAEIVRAEKLKWQPVPERSEQPGDLVLMRVYGAPIHVGMVVEPGDLITSLDGLGACLERYREIKWKARVLGFFRPPLDTPLAATNDIGEQPLIIPAFPPAPTLAVPVFARPHPFSQRGAELEVPAGLSLAEIRDLAVTEAWLRPYARVELEGQVVPESWLRGVRPKPGRVVTITVVPRESGGEGGGKNTWAVVLSVVVVIAAVALQQYWAAGVAAGTIGSGAGTALAIGTTLGSIGALMAINALLPPPRPRMRELGGATRISPSIAGTRNEERPFGTVPRVLGRMRYFPPKGAKEFTEILGNDQFLRCLFDLGLGPLRLSDFRIGETPLSQFAGVDYRVHLAEDLDDPSKTDLTDSPMTLYTNAITESFPGVNLAAGLPEGFSQVGPWIGRRSEPGADELSVDVLFPRGVGKLDKGERQTVTATVRVRYAPAGTESWVELGPFFFTDNLSVQPLRRGIPFVPVGDANGQYDVQLRQEGLVGHGEIPQEALFAEAVWQTLRTIRHVSPISDPGHTTVELRIKSSDALFGIVDTFNCIAESILPDWDQGSGTWITRATNNPASLAREVLQGAGAVDPAEDDDLDLDSVQEFHEHCTASAFTANMIVDFETTDREVLFDLCAAGRAMPTLRDATKFAVIIDKPQSIPRFHLGPRNSSGYTWERTWGDIPHALREIFQSEEADWQITEQLVFDDGFTVANATKYAEFEQVGVTNAAQLWKLGRYRFAELRLRNERHGATMDLEHVTFTRGDRGRLSHDVILVGLGQSRIAALVTAGGDTTGVVLDDVVPMVQGKLYALQVRHADLTETVHLVVTAPGETAGLTFQTPVATATGPQGGDLVQFGESGLETLDVIAREIRPGADASARILMVPYSAAVYTADTGPIPAFDPRITRPPLTTRPPAPIVDSVRSDDFVLLRAADGSLVPRIVLGFHFHSGSVLPVAQVEARIREAGSAGDWRQLSSPVSGDAPTLSIDQVEEGVSYDIRLRSVAANGATSKGWVEVLAHVVLGQRLPPPDVENVYVQDGLLTWLYPARPLDLAGFHVRRHLGTRASWGDAQPVHDDVIGGTQMPGILQPMGLVTYLVKAVDRGGRESALPGVALVNLGAVPLENLVVTKDFREADFPGTLTNLERVGGELRAITASGRYWTGVAGSPYWTGLPGSAFWSDVYAAGAYRCSILPTQNEVPADLKITADIVAGAVALEYRVSGAELFWTGNPAATFWTGNPAATFWTDPGGESSWRPFPGRLEKIPRLVHELRVRTSAGKRQGRIRDFRVHLDVPDLLEFFTNLTIPVAGVRLPIQAPYREIKDVVATLAPGGTAVAVHVLDYDPTQGPLVQAVDGAKTSVGGTLASGHIRGF